MVILFIYDAPLRPENGGTERATKLVMDELARRGHETIGLLHYDQQHPEQCYLNEKPIQSLYGFLKDNNVDVVVNQIAFHSRFLKQFLENGGEKWREKGGRIVSFMHLDPTPAPHSKIKRYFADWDKKTFFGKIKRLLFLLYLPYMNHKNKHSYKQGLRFLYDNSDRYVLMSESFLNVFTELTELEETSKVRFIPNMLTFPYVASSEILKTKEKMVLIVARLDDEQKNISFMLDAWNEIDNHQGYTLHILGDGQDNKMLRDKAKDIKDVVFEGLQSPLPWYLRASIFLMASPREGWGLTLTESLQNAVVPVVLNTSTVFKDIISDGNNGFLANSNKEYVERIEKLISDDGVRSRMALDGLSSAQRFSPSAVGDLWERMLNEIK